VSVYRDGFIVNGTIIVPGEERPYSMPRRCRHLSLNCVTKQRLTSTFCSELIVLYANKWYQSQVSYWLYDVDDLEEGHVMVVLREACFC
jgi:hypothetical protein